MRKDACILSASDIKKSRTLRITFCAYREWALKAIDNAVIESGIEVVDIIRSDIEYKKKVLSYKDKYVDCIVLVGWSWIIKDDTLNRFLCVGMHPSDLPMYRGGSPIQHQIIDGLERTKISLMTISSDGIDVGDIWLKEEWDLTGDTMSKILSDLSNSTSRLLIKFFNAFGKIKPQQQELSKGTYYKRRQAKDSKVTWKQLSSLTLKDAYNLLRALGDPYPNIYIEDEEGNKLFFREVKYQKANEDR